MRAVVVVRPRASCAAAGCACACAATAVPPLLLPACCCGAASSDEVLVIEEDETCSREGAATEDPDAIAGALSGEDIAMLLPLKLEISVSLIDQTKTDIYG